MREDDLLRLTWIADPRISPDGKKIAFVRVTVDRDADEYRTNLALMPAEGGTPRALTYGGKDSQPRWSPDGRQLAFVRATETGKPGQLHVMAMDGGEPRRLTDLPKGVSSPAWSPDGTRIAFLSGTNPALDDPAPKAPPKPAVRIVTKPMFRLDNEGMFDFDHLDHVWVVDLAGGPPRQRTQGRFADSAPAWSADGAAVWFLSDRREEPAFGPDDQDLWAVPADGDAPVAEDEVTLVADSNGPIAAFRLGPDDRVAATGPQVVDPPRSYDQGDLLLFEGPWPARTPRVVTAAYDFEVAHDIGSDCHPPRGGGGQPLGFAPGGRHVLTTVARHGACMLARVGIADGAVEELTPSDREVIAGSVTPDGRRVALVLGGLERPGVLALYDVAQGTLRELHDPNAALFAETRLGEVEEIWYESFDGRRIQGWIVKPPDFDPTRRYPLVLQIHGGPHAAYGVGFFHEFRVLAAAGYVVLATNPRGSTTYGQEFGNCIQYRYPGDDYRDLLAGVDAVIARGYVDPERLGVTGGSGGGLLTNWAITQTDRFRAAITQRCVSDWTSMWYSTDFTMFTPFWFRKYPFQDRAEYDGRSPVTFVENVKTPLLVLHSEEDWRTPIGQGETMLRALQALRKPVAMARFPGEGHELSRSGAPSRRVQNATLIRRWFDRWLQGKEAPEFAL